MRWLTLLTVLALLFIGLGPNAAGQTALDAYVAAPDPSFDWYLARTIDGVGYTGYVLNMTSQTWRSPTEVNRTEWQHWMTVIVPDGASIDTGMLYIDAGNNDGHIPTSVDSTMARGAVATNSVVVDLYTVPNQPLIFTDDGQSRREDQIIAYTFDKHLNGGDDNWPLLLPMTKSAVRAMDAVQEFLPAHTGINVNNFVVAGGSKRGWTTWLTAAVDSRVTGIIPMVIDLLNTDQQMMHNKTVYEGVEFGTEDGYPAALHDYIAYGIPDQFAMSTPEVQALLEIVDPYSYRDRYADLSKYVLNATGDELFTPDSSHFYYRDLSGEKHLRYYPNTGHSIDGVEDDAFQYYQAILDGTDMPEFSWTMENGGSTIRVTTVDAPLGARLWQASNPESRDFRYLDGNGPIWTSSPLSGTNGEYVAHVPFPESGATAFMIELFFPNAAGDPFVFTTEVSVIVVPEPSTLALLSMALIGLLANALRRRKPAFLTNM